MLNTTLNLSFLSLLLAQLALVLFCYRRLLRYLRFFQQEEYDAKRFINWLLNSSAFDKRGTGAIIFLGLLSLFTTEHVVLAVLQTVAFVALFKFEPNPVTTGKIKLNLTERARRILYLALVCLLLVYLYLLNCSQVFRSCYFANLIILIQILPLSLIVSNFLLKPFEYYTKNKFKNEAKRILKDINPFVIGITGSYGKTSVKSALGEVLNNALSPTFYPPKSFNTEMGITKSIRESLKSIHKYAVIEMGAYNVGSIKKLCSLTPPQAGIVTMVGMAHLERYGSVEQVYKAKSELAQALPEDSILVCNGDNEGARRMSVEYPKKVTLLYGFDTTKGHLDCIGSDVRLSRDGMEFTVTWKGNSYKGKTKLLGLPALSNLLAVFTMSCTLGADANFVLASIANINPVDNRLALSKEGEVTFLRDAYNSNPDGFASALNVLKEIPAERKILMTPGMIELGHKQFEENEKAGILSATSCDLVLLVGSTNREALVSGLRKGGFNQDNLILCDTRAEAFQKLNEVIKKDDLILIENDLPDLYEVVEKF